MEKNVELCSSRIKNNPAPVIQFFFSCARPLLNGNNTDLSSNIVIRVMNRTFLFCIVYIGFALSGCNNEPQPSVQKQPMPDSAVQQEETTKVVKKEPVNPFPLIRYTRTTIGDKQHLDSLRRTYAKKEETMAAYRALTTINRKDLHYFRVGDTLMIPDTVMEDRRAYSVFPYYYAAAADIPKIIVVSNKMQCYACYEQGELVYFAAANTGEERKPTFAGRYALNWKARLRKSSLNEEWKLPFTWNFHRYAGSAFHQFDMPGRPVSHSCVRQFLADAEWLYHWGRGAQYDSTKQAIPFTGTPVIIIDIFDFSRKKGGPWWDIASNKEGILSLPEKPLEVEEALIPISQIPKDVRGGLPNRTRYVTAEDTLRARGLIRPHVNLLASIDYNKRRAEKAAKKAKEEEKRRKEEEAKHQNAQTELGVPTSRETPHKEQVQQKPTIEPKQPEQDNGG